MMTSDNHDMTGTVKDEAFVIVESVRTKKSDKTLLHPMKINIPPGGGITAILGPSGGGKTTLLNFMTKNVQSGVEAYGEVQLPGTTAFVPQDDRLHGFFTCKSYLRHYARLAGIPINAETESGMDELLKNLGLYDQADTIVGDVFIKGLSGGQKRRLSVALEALSNPTNFFLDEPTSGLDAESALHVMEFLQRYNGRVVLTIHQPSSFIWKMIDHVVLLSKGKLMYQGPRSEIESFFTFAGFPTPADYNPADHYVQAVNDEFREHELSVDEWAAKYEEWKESAREDILRASQRQVQPTERPDFADTRRTASPLVVLELTYRYFLNLWFNPGILGTRIAMYAMLALMVGGLFWDLGERTDFESITPRAAILFYCVAFFVFMSVAVLPFTVIERSIVDKEVRNNYYHPIYYQLAQGLASIPSSALLAFLTSLIFLTCTKFQEPFWYFLNMFLSLIAAEALAQLVSHVVPHFVIGMAVIAGLYGFFMLFMGFMLLPSDFPDWLSWTYNVAFHTYSWRTFMFNEFKGLEFDNGQFKTGEDVLRFYEIEDVNRGSDMLVLACYSVILHVASFWVLTLKYTLFRGKVMSAPSPEGANRKE